MKSSTKEMSARQLANIKLAMLKQSEFYPWVMVSWSGDFAVVSLSGTLCICGSADCDYLMFGDSDGNREVRFRPGFWSAGAPASMITSLTPTEYLAYRLNGGV